MRGVVLILLALILESVSSPGKWNKIQTKGRILSVQKTRAVTSREVPTYWNLSRKKNHRDAKIKSFMLQHWNILPKNYDFFPIFMRFL